MFYDLQTFVIDQAGSLNSNSDFSINKSTLEVEYFYHF
jgi:hypothetical protein